MTEAGAEAEFVDSMLLGLGLGPDAALRSRLLSYLDLLQRWNATYNLTAVRDRAAMMTHHLADCLAAVPPLKRRMQTGAVLDVGSGGGLPGVVFAAAMPSLDVTCVDSVGKKAAFVTQVAGTLHLANLRARHARVESLTTAKVPLITSRAFSALSDFIRLTDPLLADGGVWLAMKGVIPHDEIASLPASVEVFHVEHLDVPGLDAQRCLIWIQRTAV